ncbi:Lecithin-cholesterol acyltransferase-like 4 [Hibiscus syriacus]|uniref:Lecithin-cholesterol acyltransferase-like 4 n=1 Tax=Hibiscus syriacus TaxID=106335 RepID=A0A6A3BT32_HIBSY|nr:Lecithin-cholesterol acyltransferase-like 4 [Hibiscus syriacus]
MWLKLRRKPQPCVDPDLDPVLLVPGIAGSILQAVDHQNGIEERVWVRILEADYKFRTKLWSRFDPATGRTVSLDPDTSIKVPEERYGLYAIDVLDPDMIIGRDCVYYFHDMIIKMTKWGFQEGKTLLVSVMIFAKVFERYVKNWIAIAAPFRGAPGYIASTFLNGVSFVEGWEQNFFISKWSMHQLLIECPSIYELMACPNFHWQHMPLLEIWKEKEGCDGTPRTILESYRPGESIDIFKEALSGNSFDYGGENLPLPFNLEILKWAKETHKVLAQAKLPPGVKFYNIYGINLETPHTVSYGSEEAPITDLQDLRFFQHWLKAGNPDPFYNPVNDYVILPTAFEGESLHEKGLEVASVKEEWEIISEDQDNLDNTASKDPLVSSISVSRGAKKQSTKSKVHATVTVHPQDEDKQHVKLNAISVSVDA